MGNDGGSIAKRRDLAKQKRVKARVSCSAVQRAKAALCALSQERLDKPVVVCRLGFLYNKEAILNAVLKGKLRGDFSHIKSLKDVQEVKFEQTGNSIICPVSRVELNGVNPFWVLWNCGCLISSKALTEIPSSTCLNCGAEVGEKVKVGQTREEQKNFRKAHGIKLKKDENSEKGYKEEKKDQKRGEEFGAIRKKAKIIDEEQIDRDIEIKMKSEVFKSLFKQEKVDETFCCRNLRAGLR